MLPAHPCPPIASSLPFHAPLDPAAAAGIHTSMLIAESLDGRSVAATRQNAGRSAYGAGAPRRRRVAGGTNAPAATSVACVTAPLRKAVVESDSQDEAASRAGVETRSAHNATAATKTRRYEVKTDRDTS